MVTNLITTQYALRYPNNVLDFYHAVKYVCGHAAELGVDPARIMIAGESGGGYICTGTMVKMAREGESGLVKLAVPIVPMISSYFFTDKEAMMKDEAGQLDGMRRIWKMISGSEVRLLFF